MYRGHRIETFIQADKGKLLLEIIINTNNIEDLPVLINELEKKFGLSRENYYEELHKSDGASKSLYKVEYVAQVDKDKNISSKDIEQFFIAQGISTENLYVSALTNNLITKSFPFLKTSQRTGYNDIILPIVSGKYFIRMINDLIISVGFNIFSNFSRWCYCNGFFSLGKKYGIKCQELSLDPVALDNPENKKIIKAIFRQDYACIIDDIFIRKIDGKHMIKVLVQDHFFLYHPWSDIRLDIHNYLITNVAQVFFRNCPLMRDILTGFFEYVFYPGEHDESNSPSRERMRFMGFEYDYADKGQCPFDFDSPNWTPCSIKNKIMLGEYKEKHKNGIIDRVETCKSVNDLYNYKIMIDTQSKEPIKKSEMQSAADFKTIDYLHWSVFNDKCIEKFFASDQIDLKVYEFQSRINKLFIDYFKAEGTGANIDSEYIVKENSTHPDSCTFYIIDKELIDVGNLWI